MITMQMKQNIRIAQPIVIPAILKFSNYYCVAGYPSGLQFASYLMILKLFIN